MQICESSREKKTDGKKRVQKNPVEQKPSLTNQATEEWNAPKITENIWKLSYKCQWSKHTTESESKCVLIAVPFIVYSLEWTHGGGGGDGRTKKTHVRVFDVKTRRNLTSKMLINIYILSRIRFSASVCMRATATLPYVDIRRKRERTSENI